MTTMDDEHTCTIGFTADSLYPDCLVIAQRSRFTVNLVDIGVADLM